MTGGPADRLQLAPLIARLLAAQERGDALLLADLLEYELVAAAG